MSRSRVTARSRSCQLCPATRQWTTIFPPPSQHVLFPLLNGGWIKFYLYFFICFLVIVSLSHSYPSPLPIYPYLPHPLFVFTFHVMCFVKFPNVVVISMRPVTNLLFLLPPPLAKRLLWGLVEATQRLVDTPPPPSVSLSHTVTVTLTLSGCFNHWTCLSHTSLMYLSPV